MSIKLNPLAFGITGQQNNQTDGLFIPKDEEIQYEEPQITPEEEQGIVADFIDKVQQGAYQSAADTLSGLRGLLTEDKLWEMENYLKQGAESQKDTLSTAQQEADANFGMFGDEGEFTGRGFMGALGSGFGSIAPSMLAGGGAGLVGKALLGRAGQVLGGAAVGAPMIGGSSMNQVTDELEAMSPEQISQIPDFQPYYQSYAEQFPEDPVGALNMAVDAYKQDAQDTALKQGAGLGAVSMGAASPMLGRILSGGSGGFKRGVAEGIGTEMVQEGIESGGQEAIANPLLGRDRWENVGTKAAEGAVIGGLVGGTVGGVGGAVGGRQQPEQPQPELDERGLPYPDAMGQVGYQQELDLQGGVNPEQRMGYADIIQGETPEQQQGDMFGYREPEQMDLLNQPAPVAPQQTFDDTGQYGLFEQQDQPQPPPPPAGTPLPPTTDLQQTEMDLGGTQEQLPLSAQLPHPDTFTPKPAKQPVQEEMELPEQQPTGQQDLFDKTRSTDLDDAAKGNSTYKRKSSLLGGKSAHAWLKENDDIKNVSKVGSQYFAEKPDGTLKKVSASVHDLAKKVQIPTKSMSKGQLIKQQAKQVNTEPTEAQKESGNYKKGHVNLDGLPIAIENPKGSTRSGTDDQGNKWESKINDHYGYFKGTKGFDKDQVDVFIKDTPNVEGKPVYVVDQINPKTGKFDEHKAMMGYDSAEEATKAYNANYAKGWKGLDNITEMSTDEFKKWARSNKPKKGPVATQDDGMSPDAPKVKPVPKKTKPTPKKAKPKVEPTPEKKAKLTPEKKAKPTPKKKAKPTPKKKAKPTPKKKAKPTKFAMKPKQDDDIEVGEASMEEFLAAMDVQKSKNPAEQLLNTIKQIMGTKLFANPKTEADTWSEIAAEIDPNITVASAMPEHGYRQKWIISVPTKTGSAQARVHLRDEKTNYDRTPNKTGKPTLELDISEFLTGDGGNIVYNMVAGFAHNNDYAFIGDTAGLSDVAVYRRTENMISTAMKYGTTQHIAPHFKQGLDGWKYTAGHDAQNMALLMEKSVDNTIKMIPDLEHIRYETTNRVDETGKSHGPGFFNTQTKEPVDDGYFRKSTRWDNNPNARKASIGYRTAKRAAFLNTLLDARSGKKSNDLESFAGQLVEFLAVDAEKIFYKRTTPANERLPKERVESRVNQLTKGWQNPPVINIVDTQVELEPDVRKLLGDDNVASGFYHNGQVYIVAENIKSEQDLEETLMHESLGHYGLDQLFGKDSANMITNMYTQLGGAKELNKIAQKQGINLSAYRKALYDSAGPMYKLSSDQKREILMEELLAHMVTNNTLPNKIKTFLGRVRKWLRENGFNSMLGYNDMDLLNVLYEAGQAVKLGNFNKSKTKKIPTFHLVTHGSPYLFREFNTAYMSKGEGAQVYGWGMYFGEGKHVAKHYSNLDVKGGVTGGIIENIQKVPGNSNKPYETKLLTEDDVDQSNIDVELLFNGFDAYNNIRQYIVKPSEYMLPPSIKAEVDEMIYGANIDKNLASYDDDIDMLISDIMNSKRFEAAFTDMAAQVVSNKYPDAIKTPEYDKTQDNELFTDDDIELNYQQEFEDNVGELNYELEGQAGGSIPNIDKLFDRPESRDKAHAIFKKHGVITDPIEQKKVIQEFIKDADLTEILDEYTGFDTIFEALEELGLSKDEILNADLATLKAMLSNSNDYEVVNVIMDAIGYKLGSTYSFMGSQFEKTDDYDQQKVWEEFVSMPEHEFLGVGNSLVDYLTDNGFLVDDTYQENLESLKQGWGNGLVYEASTESPMIADIVKEFEKHLETVNKKFSTEKSIYDEIKPLMEDQAAIDVLSSNKGASNYSLHDLKPVHAARVQTESIYPAINKVAYALTEGNRSVIDSRTRNLFTKFIISQGRASEEAGGEPQSFDETVADFNGFDEQETFEMVEHFALNDREIVYDYISEYVQYEGDSIFKKNVGAKRSVYVVDLKPRREQFLHWQKSLVEQSDYIIDKIEKATNWNIRNPGFFDDRNYKNFTGADFVNYLEKKFREDKVAGFEDTSAYDASMMLVDMGIPGSTHSDWASKTKGALTQNWVLFQDSDAEIIDTFTRDEWLSRMDEIYDKYPILPQRKDDLGLLSRTTARLANPTPKTNIEKSVSATMGRNYNREKIKVVQSQTELPKHLQRGIVQGAYDKGTVYIVADNVKPVQVKGLLLHEVGVHANMRDMLGPQLYTKLEQRVKRMTVGDLAARRAYQKAVKFETDPRFIMEETIAYMVEANPNNGFIKQALSAIKAWLYKNYGIGSNNLNNNDIAMLARMALKHSAPARDQRLFSLTAVEDYKSFEAKIDPEAKPGDSIKQVMKGYFKAFRTNVIDSYDALKNLDEEVHGKDVIHNENIAQSSWVQARMSHGSVNAVSAMLNYGRINMSGEGLIMPNHDTESLAEILQQVGNKQEINYFMNWIAANRAKRLMAEGRENLFSKEEIAAGIAVIDDPKMPSRKKRWESAYKKFNQHQNDVLKIAVKSNILSQEEANKFADEMYVPFYRVIEDDPSGVTGMKIRDSIARQQAYKKLKGGNQPLGNLLQNTIENFNHLLSASMKNNAATQAIDNALKSEFNVAEPTTEAKRNRKDSTFVLREGKKTWYNINDPLVFNALSTLSGTGMNNFMMKIMRGFKRVFTNYTTATPQFIVANVIRDSIHSAAVADTGTGMGKLTAPIRGTKNFTHKNKLMRDMITSGGGFTFGHVYGDDADTILANIDHTIKKSILVDRKSMVTAAKNMWDLYHGAANRGENANRYAVYEQAIKSGKTPMQAAFLSRDLMDFSSRGASVAVRVLTDVVPFLNARIQGLDVLYRKGIKPTSQVIKAMMTGKDENITLTDKQAAARFMSVAGVVTLASMALFMAYKDDEDFKARADWDRDMYWWFKVGGHAFRIPKPFELGAIGTFAERSLQQMVDDEATGKLFAERMGHMLSDTFSFNPIPQMMNPMINLYANKDDFTGSAIETAGMERLSPSLRSTAKTTDIAKGLSLGLEKTFGNIFGKDSKLVLSPVQIDYLVQSYLGGLGASTSMFVDDMMNIGEKPERKWFELQPFRRFYGKTDLANQRYITDVYDQADKASRAYADYRELARFGTPEAAEQFLTENRDTMSKRKLLTRAKKSFSNLNKEMKRIRLSDIPSTEKRKLINILRKQKAEIAKLSLGK